MSDIIIEEITNPEIKEQKPPETIPKDELFEDMLEKNISEPITSQAHPDKKIKKEIKILNFMVYALIILLAIVIFFIIKLLIFH